MYVIRTVTEQAVVKALQSSLFQKGVKLAVEKIFIEHHVENVVATRIIASPAFKACMATFVKPEAGKIYVAHAEIEK